MPDEAPGPGRPGRAVDEAAAREAEHAARLLGYLRDLARARRRPSRDLADHDHVHWLADLPGDVYVERDAGPGEVLFSVPVIPLTPPVVLDEFDGWLALRTWYRVLRDLAGEEVVLATGLLSWRPAVHDHLLSTPVRIVLDERTERVDVVLDGHTALRDRELLSGHPGFRPAAWVAEAVQAGQGFGLNASTGDVLRKWCQVSLTTPADCREDWAPGTDTASPVPRLRLAPALVVRPPAREAVADHHARLLSLLPRGVPDGLARFVSPARKPQIMHVPERAPETVPDLLAGLLARGHRVLVATSGPTASADLRAALPPGLAALTATDPAMAARTAEAIRAAARPPTWRWPPGARRPPPAASPRSPSGSAAASRTSPRRTPATGTPNCPDARPAGPARRPPVSAPRPPTSSSSSRRRPPRARPARPSGTSTRARCRAPPTCRPWSTPRWPPSNAPNGPRRTCRSASATPTARSSPASTGTRPSSPPRSATSASKATPAAGTAPTSPPARSATPSATGAPSSGPGSRR